MLSFAELLAYEDSVALLEGADGLLVVFEEGLALLLGLGGRGGVWEGGLDEFDEGIGQGWGLVLVVLGGLEEVVRRSVGQGQEISKGTGQSSDVDFSVFWELLKRQHFRASLRQGGKEKFVPRVEWFFVLLNLVLQGCILVPAEHQSDLGCSQIFFALFAAYSGRANRSWRTLFILAFLAKIRTNVQAILLI